MLKKYSNLVVYVSIEMDACNVLLGKPWIHCTDSTYHGRDNTAEFKLGIITIVLLPKKTNTSCSSTKKEEQVCCTEGAQGFQQNIREAEGGLPLLVKAELTSPVDESEYIHQKLAST